MISNKKLNSIVTELLVRGRKTNISIVFNIQLYFRAPKEARLSTTHLFIMKIPNRKELQQIAINHSSDIYLTDFMKIYKKCTAEKYSFLVDDMTFSSDNTLCLRKIIYKINI